MSAIYVWFRKSFGKLDFTPNWSKCEFHQFEVEFLGYVIFGDGIHMDFHKVQTIVDWATPTSIQNVQCFFRFANFYQCFIAHYSSIMALFTWLTRKDQPFSSKVDHNAFQYLNVSSITTPFFIHATHSKPFVLKTNVFDFTIGVMLSQLGEDNFLHHVNFYFHKFSFTEINYKIHHKKLLAI